MTVTDLANRKKLYRVGPLVIGSRPHRRCWPSRPCLRERWPCRLVATAAEDRLSIRQLTTFARFRRPAIVATSLQSHRPSNTRSNRISRGAQVVPPAGATVPPWLPAKSARVSNLPACCALGPPACAAPCSCHHETCSARSAWPHPGKACRSV
jgi:hypothetical protein